MAKAYKIIIPVLILIILNSGCIKEESLEPTQLNETQIKERIMQNLVGTQIGYYNVAGQPMSYNISAYDIKSINKTQLDNKIAWKVKVGSQLAWDIYFNETGEAILKKEQLFVS
ncbi:MAG: hypothetical protein E4G94_01280 [ANME-2 cluster archaeon]|nr:MAG: hypothetical protein E4G94_01280 [ANME-2 cluster archaeon]